LLVSATVGSGGTAMLDTGQYHLPISGSVRVYDSGHNLVASTSGPSAIWGGDLFRVSAASTSTTSSTSSTTTSTSSTMTSTSTSSTMSTTSTTTTTASTTTSATSTTATSTNTASGIVLNGLQTATGT